MRCSFNIIFVFLFLVSCSYTKKVNNGQVAYNAKKYALAVDLLKDEYYDADKKEEKGRLAYMLGTSYQFLNDNKSALEWYENAHVNEYGPAALRAKARSFKQEEMYSNAIEAYKELELLTGKDPLITREINICRQAQNWLKPDKNLNIEIYAFGGNSEFSDYAPTFYEDDYVVFSSDRSTERTTATYEWTGNAFSDIYIMNKKTAEIQVFGEQINSENNEATVAFNKDFSEIYFTRCMSDNPGLEDEFCKIYFSMVKDGEWSAPIMLPFQELERNYGHPALIENDSILIFTVKEIDGSETYDLHYSVRGEKQWSASEPMPSSINTDGSEKFPTVDGDTLYFSSDYLPGLGGLDIFKTHLRSDGSWTPPQNLKAPFNSGKDDFGFVVDRSSAYSQDLISKGFFASTRNDNSNDDIFGFEIRRNFKEEKKEDVKEKEPVDFSVYIAGRVVRNKYENPDNPASKLIGKDVLKDAVVTIKSQEEEFTLRTDEKGRFLQKVSKGREFAITASKESYLNAFDKCSTSNLSPPEEGSAVTINIELALDKIELNKEIVLDNIYYDFDKWNIRDEAKPSLDRLSSILSNNPDLVIELGSHTDCQGNNAYNRSLAQKRAQSAVDYIISKGIESSRLRAKGYGELYPVTNCECDNCSDEDHQANRRTTFKINSF